MKSVHGKKILITGGAGFIASHFIERVIEHNEVVVYDTLARNALVWTNLMNHKNLRFIKADVLDIPALDTACKGIDIVIHMAAVAGVNTILAKPSTTLQTNLIGSYNVLESCRKNNVPRYVSFSTSEVYGPQIYQAKESGMTTVGPIGESRWSYAISKLGSDFLGYSYYKEHGIKFTSLRPFNIYGPRQVGEGAIHNFIVKAIKNEPLIINKPGSQIRSWCYVDDMVNAMEKALENEKAVGEIFNVGNPQATSTTLQTALTVLRLANSKSKIEFKEMNYPDVEIRVPSIEKAEKLLGFEPQVSFEDGIQKTINWFTANLQTNLQKQ